MTKTITRILLTCAAAALPLVVVASPADALVRKAGGQQQCCWD